MSVKETVLADVYAATMKQAPPKSKPGCGLKAFGLVGVSEISVVGEGPKASMNKTLGKKFGKEK